MALFSKKKDEAKKPAAKAPAKKSAPKAKKDLEAAAPAAVAKATPASSHAELAAKTLLGPRITEKASMLAEKNAYAFNVSMSATKTDVIKAIKSLYGVTPKKVAIVRTKGKKVSSRRKRQFGRTNATKKAYIFLKKGETIEAA